MHLFHPGGARERTCLRGGGSGSVPGSARPGRPSGDLQAVALFVGVDLDLHGQRIRWHIREHPQPNHGKQATPMKAKCARGSESRLHAAVADAAMQHLAHTKAQRRYYEASFDILDTYGEHTPFQAACEAWHAGDNAAMERALADDRRLAALAQAAK